MEAPPPSALDALHAFLDVLDAVTRAKLERALAEISAALHGDLPVPGVHANEVRWEVPEGYVSLRVTNGALCWWASYDGESNLGDCVLDANDSPEWMLGRGLLDFLHKVLMRRAELEMLRAAMLCELKRTTDTRRLMAYLAGATQLPEFQPRVALPSGTAYSTYEPMNEFSDDDRALGKIAFDAYAASKGGVTYDNKPIPPWENVGPDVQRGWIVAAVAVKLEVIKP